MSAHSGRCFRQWRRTKQRKIRQGKSWVFPTREKVPMALRPFLVGNANQMRAGADAMRLAVIRYGEHQIAVGRHAARGR